MVSGSTRIIKLLLFIFNFLFFLTGCGLIGIGVFLNIDRDDWEGISDYNYLSVANVIIAAGAIVVIVAFFGCCGAIIECKSMLLIFFFFLLLIFILEIAAGIAAYVWRKEVEDELLNQLNKRIPTRYYKEDGVRKAMNSIQKHFKCCGVRNITDWTTTGTSGVTPMVDASCCIRDTDTQGYSAQCIERPYVTAVKTFISEYYLKGCYNSIQDFIEDNLLYVGITGIVFAAFQVVGLVFAMTLYCAIRKDSQTV